VSGYVDAGYVVVLVSLAGYSVRVIVRERSLSAGRGRRERS
jgi:hypothetical protein